MYLEAQVPLPIHPWFLPPRGVLEEGQKAYLHLAKLISVAHYTISFPFAHHVAGCNAMAKQHVSTHTCVQMIYYKIFAKKSRMR